MPLVWGKKGVEVGTGKVDRCEWQDIGHDQEDVKWWYMESMAWLWAGCGIRGRGGRVWLAMECRVWNGFCG